MIKMISLPHHNNHDYIIQLMKFELMFHTYELKKKRLLVILGWIKMIMLTCLLVVNICEI